MPDLGICAPCFRRYRREVPAARVVAGEPFCSDCFGPGEESGPPPYPRTPGMAVRIVNRLKAGAKKLTVRPDRRLVRFQQSIHMAAKRKGIRVRTMAGNKGEVIVERLS